MALSAGLILTIMMGYAASLGLFFFLHISFLVLVTQYYPPVDRRPRGQKFWRRCIFSVKLQRMSHFSVGFGK